MSPIQWFRMLSRRHKIFVLCGIAIILIVVMLVALRAFGVVGGSSPAQNQPSIGEQTSGETNDGSAGPTPSSDPKKTSTKNPDVKKTPNKTTSNSGNSSQSTSTANGSTGTSNSPNTPPVTSPPAAGWSWPSTASNTGPTTTLTTYTGPTFITANGTIIENKDIALGDGEEFVIDASNVLIKNTRIRYVGTADSDNCFICVLHGHQNITFDHIEMDGNHRFEYGLLAYSPFTLSYSEMHAASHVIDAAGDPIQANPTLITKNYIYDSDNKPFSTTNQYGGHSAAVYFSGDNSPVTVSENTLVTPRYALGPSCPPNPCHDNSVTGVIAIYADEGVANAHGSYTYHHNAISSGGFYYTQFRGGTSGIKSLTFTNNVLMADAGWPDGTIAGGTYILENVLSKTFTGNVWGSGTPNAGQAANN